MHILECIVLIIRPIKFGFVPILLKNLIICLFDFLDRVNLTPVKYSY